ncbi:MAG TPA: phage holin family protein [Candidatus Limiplasma sp.]|nr:phage holin family protein [Candidatus Limiplasma sp.]HPS81296.1 phage holin family protein [Candidatus Limiplasma sp.]
MFGAILRLMVTVAAVPLCAQYMAGVHATDWTRAALIGLILGVLYIVLRPVVRLLLKVVNWLTLGLLYVAVDAWLVWTAVGMLGGAVTLDNFWWAVAIAFVVNAARTLISALTGRLRE